jgi:prepilin-type N-terminal cleavage/methylation domain-containing protein
MPGRRGLTLIEVLVVIAVVGALLAITLPSLRAAFERSKEVSDLANLRSTHQQFYEWGLEHEQRFVNVGPPKDDYITLSAGPGNGFIVSGYFIQSSYWPLILANWGAAGSPTWHPSSVEVPDTPSILGIAVPGGRFVRETKFAYSANMLAQPARWISPACNESDRRRYNAFVLWPHVAYPAEKGMIIDTSDEASSVRATLFVDGSAAMVNLLEWLGSSMGDCPAEYFAPVEATPYGILGRDFAR